jgi:ABC-type Fe3+ transport system substrate-binding protein
MKGCPWNYEVGFIRNKEYLKNREILKVPNIW